MAKTKEELNELKKKVESLNSKLAELSEGELLEVTGGIAKWAYTVGCTGSIKDSNPSTITRSAHTILQEQSEE